MALEPDLSDPAALTRVEYTCPMHPEIVRDEPGACPICGMALEPRVVALEDAPNPELVDMTRRLWLALVLKPALRHITRLARSSVPFLPCLEWGARPLRKKETMMLIRVGLLACVALIVVGCDDDKSDNEASICKGLTQTDCQAKSECV